MFDINQDLKEKILSLSNLLENKLERVLSGNKEELRAFINNNIGQIKRIEKLDGKDLKHYQENGGIVGVDGSNNRVGGAYPHYVEAYQALAKSTAKREQPIFKTDIYTPLLGESKENSQEYGDNVNEDKKNIRLANLEVEAALESIDELKPYAIMMDGGLIRYDIYAFDKWMELKNKCEDKGIILFGVIKDIKTSMIGEKQMELDPEIKYSFYDREMLFGLLDYGEIIIIEDYANKKEPQGYASVFIRSSLQPCVIGMDIIESQRDKILDMARLVLTLTPENSRGVPLWLDMVDKEVKITDDIMHGLLERYMDRGIYQRFFISERDKRS